MTESNEILKQAGLRNTEARRKILDIFLETDEAMTIADLEKKVYLMFDKATVYRTLHVFLQNRIVVRIPNIHNVTLYALNQVMLFEREKSGEHVYFICVHCDKTICMHDVNVPQLALPKGYQSVQTILSVKGICEDCKAINTYYPTAS